MNTGVQRSGLTPYGADTTTTPAGRASWGKAQSKKDIPNLAVAHGVPYVATASVGYPYDLDKKIKKAISIKGPKYVQIHCPCPLGWRHDTSLTIILAKAAVETGLYPLLEYVDGKLAAVKKIAKPKPVEAYLQPQRRFAHLFGKEGAAARLAEVQEIANENMEKYGLAPKPTTPPADKEEKQVKTFTPAELTSFNGSGGKPVYVAYKGKVYDVSGSALWAGGSHLAGHTAGQDMTDEMLGASHGDDLLFHFPVVGKLKKH
jgi:predicted heme/steroid binding protein